MRNDAVQTGVGETEEWNMGEKKQCEPCHRFFDKFRIFLKSNQIRIYARKCQETQKDKYNAYFHQGE